MGVAKQRDGWLSKEMGDSVGRWVAKLVKGACLLRQLSGFESRHISKILKGRLKQRGGQHILAAKK
jgi:hypothetical protein